MSARPWTEAHRREALRRTYEIAAELAAVGEERRAYGLAGQNGAHDPDVWTTDLSEEAGLYAARVEREERRVRALADSPPRLVRVTTWRGQSGEEYATRAEAVADKSHGGCRLTRITRIRKATP